MKIAINCAFYQLKGGGIKEYIDNLVNKLALLDKENEYVLYVLQDHIEYAKENLPKSFRLKSIPFKSGSKWNKIKRSLLEGKFWREEERIEKFDLFHSPFFHAPRLKNTKTILTVHDLRLYRFPETYEFFRYHFLKNRVKNSIKRAEHIISISEFTKTEIEELCGVRPEKITVIPEAINLERFSSKDLQDPIDLPSVLGENPFILSVGHMEPRKNYNRLIDAYQKVKEKEGLKDLKLVIVGKKDHSYSNTLQKIAETEGVHYLNFVTGNDLMWLYKNARLFVFPSYYEGFGFPPLEAASLGTISAVSNVSSIPEVCGEAAFYFNPYDEKEIANVIYRALTDTEEITKKQKGLAQHLAKFSWETNAKETIKIYTSVSQDL